MEGIFNKEEKAPKRLAVAESYKEALKEHWRVLIDEKLFKAHHTLLETEPSRILLVFPDGSVAVCTVDKSGDGAYFFTLVSQ